LILLIQNTVKENVKLYRRGKKDVTIIVVYSKSLYRNNNLLQWILDNHFANIHDSIEETLLNFITSWISI
jgi:hypothetical protein